MFEEILKEFFGTKTFDDLFNEVFDNKVNTDDVKDDNNHSYFHSVKDEYKNGEHVSHSEKEIKDGKVIKDVDNSIELENKKNCICNDNACKCDKKPYEKKETEKECKCNDYDALKGINEHLEQSLRRLENTLAEKDKWIDELENKLIESKLNEVKLENKLNEVKRVTWKPTKEQLDALKYVIKHYTPDVTDKLGWDSIKTLGIMYLNNFDIKIN